MMGNRSNSQPVEILVPSVLLVVLGLVIWFAAFTDVKEEPEPTKARLESRFPGEISGIQAATTAIGLAGDAVANSSPSDDGLLAGDLESVSVRYEVPGAASSWTVIIRGPIRSRPNTAEEFTIDDGMIVIELSATTGDISGAFSAGRAFSTSDSEGFGVLRSLGVPSEGFTEVPLGQIALISAE